MDERKYICDKLEDGSWMHGNGAITVVVFSACFIYACDEYLMRSVSTSENVCKTQ